MTDPTAAAWLLGWDARARVVALLALALATALSTTLAAALLGTSAAFAIALVGQVGLAALAHRLRLLALFLVPIVIVVPFHRAAEAAPLFPYAWPGGPTDAGADLALLVAVRIVGASVAAALAIAVGPFDRTAKALQDLGLPRILVHMTLLAYRYTFIFGDDLGRVRAALASRGFRARPTPATLRTYGGIVGGLLVRSVDRTERLDQAMRCRGYDGRIRTLETPGVGARDVSIALGVIVLAAGVAALEVAARLAGPALT